MGNLLGAPVTEKETHRGFTPAGLAWGVSSMQGWRIHMEDAHICQPFLYAEERINDDKSDSDGGGGGGDGDGNGDGGGDEKGGDGGGDDANMDEEAKPDDEAEDDDAAKPNDAGNGNSNSKYRKISVPGHSLFAVYDGHGGSFAAEYSGMNFCRVLSRQSKFVEYAKMVEEENEKKKAEEEGNKKDADETKGTENPGSGGGSAEGKAEDREAAALDHKRQREMLNLLEDALRDAFVEIDREILREMRRLPNEDANTPYGEDFDEHHSHGEIAKRMDDEGEGGDGDGDDANANAGGEGAKTGTAAKNDGKPRLSSEDEDSGTTAIVVVLTPRYIVCANAGDSRAVYSKSSGRAVPLSYDHKPDDEEEERRIRDAGGYVSAGRVEGDLAVSRGLGDFRFKDPDAVLAGLDAGDREGAKDSDVAHSNPGARSGMARNHAMVRPEDQMVSPVPDVIVQTRNSSEDEFVVVACDGIWDVQTNLECVRTVAEIFAEGEDDVGLLCEEVLDVCLRRGSKDNMTALVVRLEAQATGEGGGVMARRELREAAAREAEEARNGGGGEGGSAGGDGEGEKRKRDDFFSGSPGYS